MNRGEFIKGLFGMVGLSLIPADRVLEVTDKIEKKGIGQNPYNFKDASKHPEFTNHMSIQRKCYNVTGGVMINGIEYWWKEINYKV